MAKKPVKTPKKAAPKKAVAKSARKSAVKAPGKAAAVKEKPVKPFKLEKGLMDSLRQAAKTSAARRTSK